MTPNYTRIEKLARVYAVLYDIETLKSIIDHLSRRYLGDEPGWSEFDKDTKTALLTALYDLEDARQPTAEEVRASALRAELQGLFDKKDLWYDAAWYTPCEWKARGESVGKGAALSMTAEGPLCHLLYYQEDGGKLYDQVIEICKKHNFWFEFGYHWSIHFYENEKEG